MLIVFAFQGGLLPKETEEELKDKYEDILGDGVDIYVIDNILPSRIVFFK